MKHLPLFVAAVAISASAVQAQNLIADPTFAGNTFAAAWEGFEGGVFAGRNPSDFVVASGGVATVTPPTANEYNFYQSFLAPQGDALLPSTNYTFTLTGSNINNSTATYWVKAFDASWGFQGAEFQQFPLVAGTNSLTFTTDAGERYYQVGVFTTSATGSYGVSNMSLVVTTIPEPSAFALMGGFAALGYSASRRRRHV